MLSHFFYVITQTVVMHSAVLLSAIAPCKNVSDKLGCKLT